MSPHTINIEAIMKKILIILFITLFSVSPAQALEIEELPGYVDFSSIRNQENKSPKVEINLGSAMLGFLAAASKNEDQELAETLSKIKAVRVLIYESKSGEFNNNIEALVADMEKDNWQPTVKVREDNESINMFIQLQDEKIMGLAVFVSDNEHETVFINIVGEIDPAQLGKVSAKLGLPTGL